MYLDGYDIFTISKNKRLITPDKDERPVGIYDAVKMNYRRALEEAEKRNASVSVMLGQVLSDGTKLICLDLDDCVLESGELEPLTKDFIKEFDYNEIEMSTSGTGMHIYILTKMPLETFIIKDMEGCKSFECYTNKRHIVTTTFEFDEVNIKIGKHDAFLKRLYDKAQSIRNPKAEMVQSVKILFEGKEAKDKADEYGALLGRTPVKDYQTLMKCCDKDVSLRDIINENPDNVDQSAFDAKLIRKLMYYSLDFDYALQLAMQTPYYQAKDNRHKKKFNDSTYIERTRKFINRGF